MDANKVIAIGGAVLVLIGTVLALGIFRI